MKASFTYRFLSDEETRELGKQIKERGSTRALHMLILHHLPLVRGEVRRLRRVSRASQEELMQVGSEGLTLAAHRWDYQYGAPFSAFAHKYVRGCIYAHLKDAHVITVPVSIAAQKVRQVYKIISLDENISVLSNKLQTRHELYSSKDAWSPEDFASASNELREAVKRVVALMQQVATQPQFMASERRIFKLSYGLERDGPARKRSLGEVSKIVGVTRQRVEQILARVWKKIDQRIYCSQNDPIAMDLKLITELKEIMSTAAGR